MSNPSRRDFLKLASALPGALALSRLAPQLSSGGSNSADKPPSVLIFVFDAMSALNLSLYGYPRQTTPNLEVFAERATVYNAHYSAGSFTTPGTASLLTGLHPWTHRAVDQNGLIARKVAGQNIFHAFGKEYFRLAFSQNLWPNYFFGQFHPDIEKVLSPAAFSLNGSLFSDLFGTDRTATDRAFDDFLFQDGEPPGSLVFGLVERLMLSHTVKEAPTQDFPDGIPQTENYPIFFRLRDVFDGMIATIEKLGPASLAYLHLWSPHEPYRPSKDYGGMFMDDWNPPAKPNHILVDPNILRSNHYLYRSRRKYDQYVAEVDAEFGRLLDALKASGALENSYVVVTSDHGQFLERGVDGHLTPLLYDPVVRVPLLISAPGQDARSDVNVPTNSVDVLPTLVHLVGGEVPSWSEGQVLPGLGGPEDPQRSIFMMDAKESPEFGPMPIASFAIRKGKYKLIYYRGYHQYGGQDKYEMYDLESDPDELNDVYSADSPVAKSLREELLAAVASGLRG